MFSNTVKNNVFRYSYFKNDEKYNVLMHITPKNTKNHMKNNIFQPVLNNPKEILVLRFSNENHEALFCPLATHK